MIDYNETRGISKETLNELLQELNPDFIKKLPDTPQEILKFAKRRVNPYISENINETLAKQMLETRQTDKEYLLTLFKAMTITFINGQDPSQHPVAAVLVSQTGAGKTSLRELINPQNQVFSLRREDAFSPRHSKAAVFQFPVPDSGFPTKWMEKALPLHQYPCPDFPMFSARRTEYRQSAQSAI